MNEKTRLFIRGNAINFEERLIDINEIDFYENNPRIASIISIMDKERITNELIHKNLWNNNNTHILMRQIETDGGLIHPIIVYGNKVLEGNTRLCCYRHLFGQTKDKKWRFIRAQIILDKLSQDDIYRLLCSEHIDGKIEWDPYEKGNLFHKMHTEDMKSIEDISKLTKESRDSIRKMIKAYKLMVNSGERNKKRFSYFLELVKSSGIKKYKTKDPEVEQKIIGLIQEGKFKDAQDLRKVPVVLEDKKSKKRLFEENKNFDDVYDYLKKKNPLIGTNFYSDINNLYNKLVKMTRNERERLKNSGKVCQKIKKITKEFIKLCDELNITIKN